MKKVHRGLIPPPLSSRTDCVILWIFQDWINICLARIRLVTFQ
jgi:hypothetical protein